MSYNKHLAVAVDSSLRYRGEHFMRPAWRKMLKRCREGETAGRVCARWRDKSNGFNNFLSDMGVRPSGFVLARIDTAGDFTPLNCVWDTLANVQRRRRSCRDITFNGETKIITAWAEEFGLAPATLIARLKNGWSIRQALTAPLRSPDSSAVVKNKDRIRSKLNKAVRRGKIKRPDKCEYPGCNCRRVTAHHYLGYADEHVFDVQWLCHTHHAQVEYVIPRATI